MACQHHRFNGASAPSFGAEIRVSWAYREHFEPSLRDAGASVDLTSTAGRFSPMACSTATASGCPRPQGITPASVSGEDVRARAPCAPAVPAAATARSRRRRASPPCERSSHARDRPHIFYNGARQLSRSTGRGLRVAAFCHAREPMRYQSNPKHSDPWQRGRRGTPTDVWHGYPVGWKHVPYELRRCWRRDHQVTRRDISRYSN